jgi:hypothetical protein
MQAGCAAASGGEAQVRQHAGRGAGDIPGGGLGRVLGGLGRGRNRRGTQRRADVGVCGRSAGRLTHSKNMDFRTGPAAYLFSHVSWVDHISLSSRQLTRPLRIAGAGQ